MKGPVLMKKVDAAIAQVDIRCDVMSNQPHVVILGAGFGGIGTLKRLREAACLARTCGRVLSVAG
jgi:hypothetical protein